MRKYKWEFLLLISTAFFGIAYSIMNITSEYLGPFSANTLRFVISFVVLIPFSLKKDETKLKDLIIGAFIISIVTFVATFVQQAVADRVSSAKLGFITSMYIVFVPFLSYFFNKIKPAKNTVIAIIIAVIGLYLLCGIGSLNFNVYDLTVLIAAICFTFEIVFIDIYSKKVAPLKLTTAMLGFVSVYNLIFMLALESPDLSSVKAALPEILINALGCTALATVFQMQAQKHVNATLSALIMSLESVFSAIAGFVVLNQTLTIKELIGCLLMFVAILVCELVPNKNKESC